MSGALTWLDSPSRRCAFDAFVGPDVAGVEPVPASEAVPQFCLNIMYGERTFAAENGSASVAGIPIGWEGSFTRRWAFVLLLVQSCTYEMIICATDCTRLMEMIGND